MAELNTYTLLTRLARTLRDWDARLEHGLFTWGERIKEGLWRIRHASDAVEPSPGGRIVVSLACEALTYAAIGGVLLVGLAKPAFRLVAHDHWLKQQDLSVTFLDSEGQVLGHRGILHSQRVALHELPEHLIRAALATEDRLFFNHYGIDPLGLVRALRANSQGGRVMQGGSTITQQLAKNLFLNAERSLDRKIKEAFLALWLEARLTKPEILKLYLDRAYMGGGVFGVQSAAEYYFGKDVRDITLAEAAMIAGLFKAPTKFSPMVNLPAARARAADVLSNMVEAKFLTQGQIASALRNPATPVERANENMADYALDYGFEEVRQLAAEGKLGRHRILTVRSTIDRALQKHAEASSEAILQNEGKAYNVRQSAVVVLDHAGGLRAMVGGRDYGQSQFNRAVQAMRPPGSSFKPFVYAAALIDGVIEPTSIVTDKPTCVGNWCPHNYGRSYAGSMPATVALAKSINTIPVQLNGMIAKGNHKLGRQKVIALTKSLGFQNDLRDVTALPIGASEVNVVDMATGFNTFANGGKLARTHVAREIITQSGEVIYRAPLFESIPQVMPAKAAMDLNFMLSKVVTEGTGRRATLPGIPGAGKTGTTDEYRNAWYIGYTGNFTTAVWMGNDDYSPTNNMTGGTLPAMVFARVMAFAHLNTDLKPLAGLGEEAKPVRDAKLAVLAGTTLPAANAQQVVGARLSPTGRTLLRDIIQAGTLPDPREGAAGTPLRDLSQLPPSPPRG